MNFLKGYRTAIFNVVAFAVALSQYYNGPLPAVDPGQFTVAVTVVNFLLRFFTTSPIFNKA